MRAKDLKFWLREATRAKAPVWRRWELLVRLLHRMFEDGTPPEDLAWATMVLIPKGKGGFRGIGLVKVAWKVFETVVNCRLKKGFLLQNALHRLRGERRTGNPHWRPSWINS